VSPITRYRRRFFTDRTVAAGGGRLPGSPLSLSAFAPPPSVPFRRFFLRSLTFLTACSATLPPSASSLRPRRSPGEHGQSGSRASSRPVRRLLGRIGGFPIPARSPSPPPSPARLRARKRTPAAVRGRRTFLYRRITKRLLLGLGGQLQRSVVRQSAVQTLR